jgi:hypothetical protein
MMREITRPHQIPYRIIVPQGEEGRLVPAAAANAPGLSQHSPGAHADGNPAGQTA